MCYIWATCVKQATIRNSLTSQGDVSRRKVPTAEGLQLVVLIRRLLDAVLHFVSVERDSYYTSATHSCGHLRGFEDAAEVR